MSLCNPLRSGVHRRTNSADGSAGSPYYDEGVGVIEHDQIVELLGDQVETARERYQESAHVLDGAIRSHIQETASAFYSHHQIRLAARAYKTAGDELIAAVARLQAFIVHGIVPHEFVTKLPQKIEKEINSRQSA
jgi:hypothetical protein